MRASVPAPALSSNLDEAVADVIEAGRSAATRGWVPATSGNFSARLDRHRVAITASGVNKGSLRPQDVLAIRLDEPAPGIASAETELHLAAYRRDAGIGAVAHIHSLHATLLSRQCADAGEVVLRDYELLKAFAGIRTHETVLRVPVVANSQDIAALSRVVESRLDAAPGYLIAGHGLYAWGRTMADALRHAEAFEFLFQCELGSRT